MEQSIIETIRQAIRDGEKEVLSRTVASVIEAGGFGYSEKDTLTLLHSAAIKKMLSNSTNALTPESIAGAVLNGAFLGCPGNFVAGKIAVSTEKDGKSTIALVSRGTMPKDQSS